MTEYARVPGELRDAALRWIADDPSPQDRAELQRVLADALAGAAPAVADLRQRLEAPLTFGTAGLRGPLRAGPAGMNLAVVRRAAAGIGAYLVSTEGRGGTVVVGFDARHRSAEFATEAAQVLTAKGFDVLLAPAPLPTPITAYAVRRLGAVAGLQVTASHNPPADNGLKVYLRGGAQLVGPADAAIEAAIAASAPAVSIGTSGRPRPWPDELVHDYLERAAGVAGTAVRNLRLAVTPLHGVGGESLVKALHLAGFSNVSVVAEQAVPDPEFPTVAFPNPEEPGACDLLLALAEEIGADLAIANDPDADRCALGVRDTGGWRMLDGNETGSLLGERLLAKLDRSRVPDPLVATTIVSSELLGRIAAAHGVRYDETLTGFKWIVRSGDGDGTGLVFGYEEALGLAVDPAAVRDKDGISAAVLAAALADELRSAGRTLPDALDDLARAHGLHTTDALSLRVDDLTVIQQWMADLRADPPTELLGEPVTTVDDLLPRTDGLRIRTGRARVVVRPSGTEPKLKCYLEIVTPVAAAADLTAVRARAHREMAALRTDIAGLFQHPGGNS